MFDKKTYVNRRARLMKEVGDGVLLFLGNQLVGMNYHDNEYPFRQDSTFLYYFGLDQAGLAAVIDIDRGEEVIFGDELTIDDIVWTGTMPSLAENARKVGVDKTLPLSALKEYLGKAMHQGRKIRFLPPYRADHKVRLMDLLGILPNVQSLHADEALIRAIVDLRIHKTAEEVAVIEDAVDVSTRMHLEAYRLARPGVHEAEIAAAVLQIASSRPGGGLAFPTIATVAGQVLHNHGFIHTLKDGDIFLLDAGAENAEHYCGDLSSSMPVSDRFTPRQEEIYRLHLRSFQAAVDQLRPGNPYRNAHLAAAEAIAEGMVDLGLMKGCPRDIAESGAYALVFPCGTGHMMGLDVHNMENLGEQYVGYAEGEKKSTQFGFKSLRLARPLEPGFVFTVEPGIYFIPELIDRWKAEGRFKEFINYDKFEAWKGFGGLRNELDYLITEDGCRVLGTIKKPMTLEEVYTAKNL
jgi:Xaa-Pro aminopeptidase